MKTPEKLITKASGKQVPFSEEKLKQSLSRSGAAGDLINAVTEEVKKQLYEGIPTHKIHKLAFGLLNKNRKPFAAKYKLKEAIMELGPTGFPFERYIAAILQHDGFVVKTDQVVKGNCVRHEIDVIAEKEEKRFMVECKYHNAPGISCDVKIPLYIDARFRDVEQEWNKNAGDSMKFHQGWLVTNTRFTSDAIQYGVCAGLHLVGWNFPAEESLNILIERSGLYPLTCLTTLSDTQKQALLDENIVLSKEIGDRPDLLKLAGIEEPGMANILDEIRLLCKTGTNAQEGKGANIPS